ncbi:hypothetical protein [Zymomonas mobilis]|uniref:Uncharacterized protein n=1 Tax=Zymomonas mobilis subsp. mobilis (strain ATCC 10988 / DSM 424 / LMG 404 / NCIMB 8938 / NRRL B-806 / ZM1) TaxID=555217 RepID=A0A0H3FZD6_ZYMMA|nr:hypothetical protein [Zymomonas mobilis]AEH63017.1 hypothetical protein Zmob_1188 [Zymomonas mobilis subsp. mobilis ATCC 10988]TQL27373.1 hypothetical protein FBY55_0687 [Zymomonas mobilis]TQL29316.1 hypothetical protein FBY54_0119 [Zymomonas mobilis]
MYENLFLQINNNFNYIKKYINKHDLFWRDADLDYFSQNENEFHEFIQKREPLILETLGLAGKISLLSKENMEGIKKFLSVFVNGDNFYAKDIEIKLPKIDGGFETIKRTVP